MATVFQRATPQINENPALRIPQREGFFAIQEFFEAHAQQASEVGIVLPVGSGKSGLIAIAPFAVKARRVLVVAPGLRIADQLLEIVSPQNPHNFYRERHVLKDLGGIEPAEIRGSTSNLSDLDAANIVITNIQQLQRKENAWLRSLPSDFFDLIINDEAHHNVAESWEMVRRAFPKANVVNFSATPDRADGRRMAGQIIYTFPVFRAIAEGYVKRLSAVVLNPRTLRYVRRTAGTEVSVDLEEVKRLGQADADFRRSIVSSSESLATIVDASIQELETRRRATADSRHKIIASALNMEHCIQITEAYRARGLKCDYVHSKLDSKVNDKILKQLNNHELDALVQVRMLGEGFDHPYFSVAAILSIFANLSPFVQFVGRIMRSVNAEPGDPNNSGTVVFHAGANVARLWDDFRDFSEADQDFFDQLLPLRELFVEDTTEQRITPSERPDYEPPVRITTQDDIGLESIPLLANDAEALSAISLLASKGVTAEVFAKALEALTPTPVTQQKRRQAARAALDQRIRNLTAKLLAANNLSAEGHDLDTRHLGRTNYVLLKAAIDRECNRLVGKRSGSRAELSQADLDTIEAALPQIASDVSEKILSGKA
ncbi:MAG: DEAD/DEAH box helicase family protein [Vulcanimicrobiaceae bacterium]|jgi:superfamily II DNA or RNA helicase